MSILLIGGSPSVSSRSGRLLEEIGTRLEQEGLAVDRLHVRELPAQALLHANFKHPEIVAALRWVENAAGIVIGTPVYKAAHSGVLKAFIDLLPQFANSTGRCNSKVRSSAIAMMQGSSYADRLHA